MKIIFSTLKKVLFWSYDRGTWQYDVMCVLILAFIFFTPGDWFKTRWLALAEDTSRAIYVTSEEVGPVASENPEQEVADYLSRKYGRKLGVARIEQVTSETTGSKAYLVWTKE
jgi:hypothetical protein